MSTPLTVDVPHRLGKEGAKARLRDRIGELKDHIPGGLAQVTATWPTADAMALEITAMGQLVTARLLVKDALVRVELALPAMLSFFSGAIAGAVRDGGTRVLAGPPGPA